MRSRTCRPRPPNGCPIWYSARTATEDDPLYSVAMTTAKITISLPVDLLRLIDDERKTRSMSRSEYIRSALIDSFARADQRNMALDYVRAYGDRPEKDDEVEAALEALPNCWRRSPGNEVPPCEPGPWPSSYPAAVCCAPGGR
ncbi:MAG: ribbon-helix-helix protein, CopG family [Actinobacteria bacterium]|nr:ribbon-helix-helix protein, CopG family [Actinomycetota bacterium]